MTTLTASQARIPTDIFNRVVYRGERVRIRHRSGATAALVSEEDLAAIEAIEDRLDAQDFQKAMRRFKKTGGAVIPWEQVKKEAGL